MINTGIVERNNCLECIHNDVCSYKENYRKAKEELNKYINQNILNPESGKDNSNISINIGCNKYFSSCKTRADVFNGEATYPISSRTC